MKRQVMNGTLALGGVLSVLACVQFFRPQAPGERERIPHSPTNPENARQLVISKGYYSHLAFPGTWIDVICVSREHVDGEKPPWAEVILEGVQVVDYDPFTGGEWTNVTFNLTSQQAEKIAQAEKRGHLRFFLRPNPSDSSPQTDE